MIRKDQAPSGGDSRGRFNEEKVRADLIRRLNRIIARLPNGLLHRLLADAEFFEAWNLRKKGARSSARMAQHKAELARIEEKYWQRVNAEAACRSR